MALRARGGVQREKGSRRGVWGPVSQPLLANCPAAPSQPPLITATVRCQNLGGSHGPASTPLLGLLPLWRPLHWGQRPVPLSIPHPQLLRPGSPGSGPTSLLTGCVTLGESLPVSGAGMSGGIQAQENPVEVGQGPAEDGPPLFSLSLGRPARVGVGGGGVGSGREP